jgi:uncharacterized membrane protein
MRILYLTSVWLHILTAAVWIGGMVFLVLVLVPVVRRSEYRGQAAGLLHLTGERFRWVGWVCLALFVLTGTVNLAYRGYEWIDLWDGTLWSGWFGRVLGTKLLLVALIFAMSAVHDFVIGPRATAMMARSPTDEATRRMRRTASWFGRLNLLVALIVVMLGIMLVRGGW